MPLPILYSFRRCPYAMRARLALYISKIEYEHREILLKNKPFAMLEASPKGTVPVLVLPNGQVLEESLDIMLWALHENDPESWLLGASEEMHNLISHNDGVFKKQLDRYKYPNRYPDEDCTNAKEQGFLFLKNLEKRLTKQPYLISEQPKLADMALFPFIRQFSKVDEEAFYNADLPHLQKWLKGLLSSDIFNAVMKKHPIWVPLS